MRQQPQVWDATGERGFTYLWQTAPACGRYRPDGSHLLIPSNLLIGRLRGIAKAGKEVIKGGAYKKYTLGRD